MGITDFFSDIISSLPFTTEAYAEAPAKDDNDGDDGKDEGNDEEESKDDEGGDEGADGEDGGEDGGDEGGDEEEEEEEEPEDPKPKLEEECANSSKCAPYKHHFDACVERVTAAQEDSEAGHKGPKEDCVEEFFHLQHCATQCAAPKLFRMLK